MPLAFHKEDALPGVLEVDSFYFVENGNYAESYLTDDAGNAKMIGNSVMIAEVATPLITAALAQANRVEIVADIAARDALNGADRNQIILVVDASADATVDAGSALYAFRNSDNTFIKIAEYESMDFALTWAGISGKPASTPADIDDAVAKRHTHANLAQLNKIGEDGGGNLTYDGDPVLAVVEWDTVDW